MVCVPTADPAVYRALVPLALMVPTVLLPPATPSTAQVAAPPPGTVAVNCCVCVCTTAAIFGRIATAPLEIVTVAVATLLVPPAPLQLNEYAVVVVSAPVLCVPLAAFAPLQPPEAV